MAKAPKVQGGSHMFFQSLGTVTRWGKTQGGHTMGQDTGGSHDGAKQESSKNTLHLKFLMAGAAVFAS